MREEAALERVKIGRLGERLSLRYELERTCTHPKWQAFETNFAGYDVLSIKEKHDSRHLKIEVKASTRRFKEAIINITEHEWRTAQTALDDYIFHVWILDTIDQPEKCSLFIVKSSEIAPHIPLNQGKGAWKQTALQIGAVCHPSKAITTGAPPG